MALAAVACALFLAPVAMASEFTVDSGADEVDLAPGDEACLTAGGNCTLRAAIEEADSLGETARIEFAEEPFDGGSEATIDLGSGLPAITVRTIVNGRFCETTPGINRPCVGIDGPAAGTALAVEGAAKVELRGLAVTGAQTAVDLEGASNFKLQTDWFGIALDGSPGPNGTGVLVGPGSNGGLVGSEGAERRDVFAASNEDGLDVHGASGVKVLGNYFGVEPDGVTPAGNGGDDIEVASVEGAEATGTSIGTRVSAAAASSPQCDGGCNVISAAGADGIDLQGDGEPEGPAGSTTVVGNYVGLDALGTGSVPNADAGVSIGEAGHTAVGGPAAGEANLIAGGAAAIVAGPAASSLAIRGNTIGTDVNGGRPVAPPEEGIVVNSAELSSPANEAQIVGNEIWTEGGAAIAQRGEGGWILGNRIFGSRVGIATAESTAEHGNVIEGNSIVGPVVSGILIENDFNEIVGNEVLGAGGAGISIQGALLPFGASGNLIGGDLPADENVISGGQGDAIEISDLTETENEVARNRGSGNSGLFIDLVPASPSEPKGPNNGIAPPMFATATQAEVSGFGAEPEATIRVFRKQSAAAGEIDSFLGEATADGEGNWKVAYENAVPGGTIVAATQTSLGGGTSELATATVSGSAQAGAGGGAGAAEFGAAAAGGVDRIVVPIRPRTKIVKAPRRRIHGTVARFGFESNEAGSVFLCKLDDMPFDLCGSPRRYAHLRPGRHLFEVRAVDPAGHVDLTPAKKQFVVVGER